MKKTIQRAKTGVKTGWGQQTMFGEDVSILKDMAPEQTRYYQGLDQMTKFFTELTSGKGMGTDISLQESTFGRDFYEVKEGTETARMLKNLKIRAIDLRHIMDKINEANEDLAQNQLLSLIHI